LENICIHYNENGYTLFFEDSGLLEFGPNEWEIVSTAIETKLTGAVSATIEININSEDNGVDREK
jgi:hypothetical protein